MNRKQEKNVKVYFEEIARKFDSYYREEADTRGLIGRIAHAIFRRPGMVRRFGATFSFLGEIGEKRILDVGCGSGIYSIEVARRGGYPTGIDVSPMMIELARENAGKAGCSDRCSFMIKDLNDFEPEGGVYDAVIAIGLFDYIHPEKQRGVLAKLLSLTEGQVIATFPKRWVPGAFIRAIWFMTKDLDVYFVTRSHVRGLVDPTRTELNFHNCGPIWTVSFRKR